MAQHASGPQGGASKPSWLDRAVDILKPQPGPPPKPPAPPVDQGARRQAKSRSRNHQRCRKMGRGSHEACEHGPTY